MNNTMRWSFANLVTGTPTASSEQAAYPATNLLRPQEPFMPWKSVGTGTGSFSISLTSPATFVILVAANFTSATLNGTGITLTRNPFNWRYHYGVIPASPLASISLSIPNQATTDGASYFRLGGVWAGTWSAPPMNVRFDVGMTQLLPVEDLSPNHRAWTQRLHMGEPRARFEMTRMARLTRLRPGAGDHLQAWSEIDRQTWDADMFGFFFNDGDSSKAMILRRIGDVSWDRRRLALAEGRLTLEEVIR